MQLSLDEQDIIRWNPSTYGIFSVKPAYKKPTEARVRNQAALNAVPTTVWKALWKMKMPHRVKLFIWKCLKNIVPTRVRLTQAMQDIERHCEICKQENETLFHLLLSCSHAKAVWRSLNINIDHIITQCHSITKWIISWFQDVQNAGNEDVNNWRSLLMVGSWIIWKERCDCVFQDKSLNPIRTAERIQRQLISYSALTHEASDDALISAPNSTVMTTNSLNCLQDILNEASLFKFFVYTSFDKLTNDSGSGIVFYDTAGAFVGFKGSYAAGIIDAEAGECRDVLEGLKWAKAMELDGVHIISDTHTVVNSINNKALSVRWENRKIIQEINQLLISFNLYMISYVHRTLNSEADSISKVVWRNKLLVEEFSHDGSHIQTVLNRILDPGIS
ncbi:uncharacterized protein LOC113360029 [Papaver somniferum]|uniref:uncharacterized protein LOC113360029 n=1 Tax=Papaver somniferum TaxID=3469 RepID=UPI000E6F8889|nr:uncharacterized protein LOC113360029 [Papaver somniferum]